MVELIGVTAHLNGLAAIDGLSLTIGPGLTVVCGDTGAGKTTLLRLLAGVLEPDEGTVEGCGSSVGWLCVAAPIGDVPGPTYPALVERPDLVLCDDITFGLPRSHVGWMIDQLRAIADSGSAVVATTHRDDLPMLADRAVHLERGRLCASSV